jgi:uncharacterized protein (TIGR00730 family)
MNRDIRTVCVYCASSRQADGAYARAATELGRTLAEHGIAIRYGGGLIGSMGALAEGALAAGGRIAGILPRFMADLEWGHPGLTELRIVANLHERKARMIEGADAVIALPGGCGTFEELLEAITWKRLGLYVNPIIMVNTLGYFDPLIAQLDRAITERFMDERHRAMWSVVERATEVVPAIAAAPPWPADSRAFAAM